jgi:hypothetical protein
MLLEVPFLKDCFFLLFKSCLHGTTQAVKQLRQWTANQFFLDSLSNIVLLLLTPVAQLEERMTFNHVVVGSSPTRGESVLWRKSFIMAQ